MIQSCKHCIKNNYFEANALLAPNFLWNSIDISIMVEKYTSY